MPPLCRTEIVQWVCDTEVVAQVSPPAGYIDRERGRTRGWGHPRYNLPASSTKCQLLCRAPLCGYKVDPTICIQYACEADVKSVPCRVLTSRQDAPPHRGMSDPTGGGYR